MTKPLSSKAFQDAAPLLTPLTPAQADVMQQVETGLQSASVIFIGGAQATGKTLVLKHLQTRLGGKILGVHDVFDASAVRNPGHWEETLMDLLLKTHADHDIILFDDMQMVEFHPDFADRPGYQVQLLNAYFSSLTGGKKKVVITSSGTGEGFASGYGAALLPEFKTADYRQVLEHHAGRSLPDVDFDDLHLAHRYLNGRALAFAGNILSNEAWPVVDTDALVSLIDEFIVQSNVAMSEVAEVSFDTLVGVEDLIDVLDRTVLIPMTQPELAKSLGLRPKRGILLYGPPGTGKTTIGRALAQRMRGKFFMIDGTFRPDDHGFHMMFDRILLNAQRSSPSVIFIDDADVIFRNGRTVGFARKLLSKLDGMSSESQSHVCVVMTAMDVADMPPAMVRSGRVEVWLEMTLPDPEKRKNLIRYFASDMEAELKGADWGRLAAATDEFTPADIRGLVGDARAHVGYDRRLSSTAKSFEDYLLLAAGEIAGRKALLKQI